MGSPFFVTVENTSIPQASIEGRASSGYLHSFSFTLHERHR